MLALDSARRALVKAKATDLIRQWQVLPWLRRAIFFLQRKSSHRQPHRHIPSPLRFDLRQAATARRKRLHADHVIGRVAIFL